MSTLKIISYPDTRLRIKANPIKEINSTIKSLIKNMFKIMYKNKGIGLAATQVNIHKQIIVIDISKNKENQLILINPIILEKFGHIKIEEKCLSIPNYSNLVPRYKFIKVKAKGINNKNFVLEANDLLSICIQHEIDHLNGKLLIDYLSIKKNKSLKNKI